LSNIRQDISSNITIQGNFDPTILFSHNERITKETQALYGELKNKNIIANLGHGVLPATPIESVESFLKAIKNL